MCVEPPHLGLAWVTSHRVPSFVDSLDDHRRDANRGFAHPCVYGLRISMSLRNVRDHFAYHSPPKESVDVFADLKISTLRNLRAPQVT